jgi:hypothetical protein
MIDHLPRADEKPGPYEAPWWLEDAFYGTDEAEEAAWLAGLPTDVRDEYEAGPWTGAGESMAAGFLARLRDEGVTVIVAERRDRFARFGGDYVEAALAAPGRRLLVADRSGGDDDLAGDVTEILTSLGARRYGPRAAAGRARRAVPAVTGDAR